MSDQLLRGALVALLALPLAAGVAAAILGAQRAAAVRWLALGATLVSLVLASVLTAGAGPRLSAADPQGFNPTDRPTFRPIIVPGAVGDEHRTTWDVLPVGLPTATEGERPAVQFFVGLDGLNLALVDLTCLLMVAAVLASWTAVTQRVNEYFGWLLALQTGLLGVFVSFDIILFYVFFELTLVPVFFLIGLWGGSARREAALKFFLFTLAGSLVTLVGMLGVVVAVYARTKNLTFSIPELVALMQNQLALNAESERAFWQGVQTALFLTLAAGFAVKVPLVPLHTWQPFAYAEAPTAVTVILSGVLAKLGTYGLLRLCLPLAPDASLSLGVPLLGTLAAVGIVYGSLCAYAQDDLKRLVAYSSVSHLGFVTLGLFALNQAGLSGGLLQMVNHGLYTAGLFLVVGALAQRYETRQLPAFGGLAAKLKVLAVVMMFFCLASVGLPGLNAFVGEFLMLAGVFDLRPAAVTGKVFAAVAALGIVLTAWYIFTMLKRVFFGPLQEPAAEGTEPVRDVNGREAVILVPLVLLCLLLGVYPQPLLDVSRRDVAVVTHISDQARQRAGAPPAKTVAAAGEEGRR
jgi:NADH-quinone oxidoreductase subunit M